MRQHTVGSVMTTQVVRAAYDTPFKEVARLLGDRRISGLPVVDADGRVVGVVSETDLLVHQAGTPSVHDARKSHRFADLTPRARKQAAKAEARTAGHLMTGPPVTVHAEDSIVEAARTMDRHHVGRLPVLDADERLVGIVTRRDLLRVFLRSDTEIRAEVIDEVLVRALWLPPLSVDVAVTEGVVTLSGQMERKSETEIAVAMTRRIDGVVAVVDHLTHRLDDPHARPGEQPLHGVSEEWLRSL
ncbi:CBS domain-containing protein [Streptomyces sp. NPDC046909]|uniref:CBS domain-containing protein n=1 Tax=Streptomyces sp. NPDC046909 TaxID=3155617 RepID=UPI003411E28A